METALFEETMVSVFDLVQCMVIVSDVNNTVSCTSRCEKLNFHVDIRNSFGKFVCDRSHFQMNDNVDRQSDRNAGTPFVINMRSVCV